MPYSAEGTSRRKLAAVLAADVVGYARLMEAHEVDTHNRLMNLRFTKMEPAIAAHDGKVVKNTGDGFIALFDSAHEAAVCAIEMQRTVQDLEEDLPPDRRIAFRMAINLADVIVEEHDIYGDGVNVAARLQTYAEPGGIIVAGAVADQMGSALGVTTIDLGDVRMHNFARPTRLISLRLTNSPVAPIGEAPRGNENRPSIAVLPFRKSIPAPKDGYFADGVVDNVIEGLGSLKELFVISRGSTLAYGGPSIDVRAVGLDLGVRYVLYGSIQRAGGRLRISTELSDAETGEVIRSDHHDGTIGELFELQDRIAIEVAKTIAPNVRERELARAKRKHPQNMTAYDLVLQAYEPLARLDEASFARARGLLQHAMTVDPTYAPAFSHAAWWHSYRIGQGWSKDIAIDASEAARLSAIAIELNRSDSLALAVYGHHRSYLLKDFNAALQCFDDAIEACPNSAIAWTLKGATCCFIGDGRSAVPCAETGLRLSPRDNHVFFAEHILAQSHYVNNNFDEAVRWARRSHEHNGYLTSNLRTLAASLVATGCIDEAREVTRRHQNIVPNFHLLEWAARTPMIEKIKHHRVERLRLAGLPD